MSDIARYGAGDLQGGYYFVRENAGMGGAEYAVTYFIDGLGETKKVATGRERWTREEIAQLPTLTEAITQHLAPAFEEAEQNRKGWVERRKQDGYNDRPTPAPAHVDRATERLFSDDL